MSSEYDAACEVRGAIDALTVQVGDLVEQVARAADALESLVRVESFAAYGPADPELRDDGEEGPTRGA